MGIFKRKKKNYFVPGSTVTLYGVSDENIQTSQLINLSNPTIPGYPVISSYYGEVLPSSGTSSELESWMQPSGTAWEYPVYYAGEIKTKSFSSIFERIICKYCGQSFMFDERQVKSPIFILSCPCCGGRI